jgi:hypothetical protein
VPTFLRSSHKGEYTSPRTVLGFYAGVLIILEAGVVALSAVLAADEDLHYLIPWLLLFGGVLLVAIIAIVVVMNVRDPTKLQLEGVTGREFIAYQRITRGDSISGEYVEEVPIAVSDNKAIEVAQSPEVPEGEAGPQSLAAGAEEQGGESE